MAEFILKDRYGKDRSFDKETIFVQGADGELMQFTHGTGNPVIESLTITENGTYNAPEGVDGYNPVTVAVPAPEIKLQDKTITENGEYTADSGFDGLGKVLVQVASASAGGSNVKFAFGVISTEQSSSLTVQHNLGVIPDVVLLISNAGKTNYYTSAIYGFSRKLSTLIGGNPLYSRRLYCMSNAYWFNGSSTFIDSTSSDTPCYNATETSVMFAAAGSAKIPANSVWIAIAGLAE